MAIYEGYREAQNGPGTVTVDGEPLDPRNDLFNHSPDGFQWGYGGSGPAQLALAILAHHFRDKLPKDITRTMALVRAADERAVKLHQAFKSKLIAAIDHDHWN